MSLRHIKINNKCTNQKKEYIICLYNIIKEDYDSSYIQL